MIPKYIVLTIILVLTKNASTYKQYKYHELCPANKLKRNFDRSNDNKPTVKLNHDDLSAALVQHQWNSTTYTKSNACDFDVKLDDGDLSGIFVLLKRLNLREHKDVDDNYCGDKKCAPCIDYLILKYNNGTRTREICGNIETTVESNLIRNFFDEISGKISVEIYINSSYPLEVNNSLEVDLVFTAYTNCYNDTNEVACSSVRCISDIFVNDSILNCPPPFCSDEIGCKNNETVEHDESSVSSSTELYIVISLVVVIVSSLICLICCCNKRKPTFNPQQRCNNERARELRLHPTTVGDFDSYLEFQNVRPTSLDEAEPQHERTTTHSAPRVGFKTEPPTYDALFNANTNKRAPEPIIKKF